MLESLLQIGRRRAQQLLSPIATRRVGASIVARREEVIAHLNRIAAGETAFYEGRRRRQLWDQLGRAGRITVRFSNPDEALEKLMALALAIGHNRAAFEQRVAVAADAETTEAS
jgi:hypothetical protein